MIIRQRINSLMKLSLPENVSVPFRDLPIKLFDDLSLTSDDLYPYTAYFLLSHACFPIHNYLDWQLLFDILHQYVLIVLKYKSAKPRLLQYMPIMNKAHKSIQTAFESLHKLNL